MGADNIIHLPSWYKYDEIIEHVHLLIAPRRIAHSIDTKNKPEPIDMFNKAELAVLSSLHYDIINFPLIDIASSHIRQRLKEGKSVRYMVPESVWQLISEEKIYQ